MQIYEIDRHVVVEAEKRRKFWLMILYYFVWCLIYDLVVGMLRKAWNCVRLFSNAGFKIFYYVPLTFLLAVSSVQNFF